MELTPGEMIVLNKKLDDSGRPKKSINVKENLKEYKIQRMYSTRSPTRLRLENTLPKKQEKENLSQIYLKNYLANTANRSTIKPESVDKANSSNKGVFIMGPDGKISNAGYTLTEEQMLSLNDKKVKDSSENVVYKLEPDVLPYLYHSKKLDDNVNINYGNMLDKPFELLNPLNKKELTKLLDLNEANFNLDEGLYVQVYKSDAFKISIFFVDLIRFGRRASS